MSLLLALGSLTPPQEAVRRGMLAFHAAHPLDCHQRSCLAGHFTGSAMLVDAAGERVLLTHHRKLDRWLQLGGHADGNANLRAVALREAQEESGIADLRLLPRAIDLDIHTIPTRGSEPEHLHLDVRFLVAAPADAQPAASEESHELRWLLPEEARTLGIDDSVGRLLDRLFPR